MIRRTHAYLIVPCLTAALVGCATVPEPERPTGDETDRPDAPQPIPAETPPVAELELPELELLPRPRPPVPGLSGDDLFRLLVADLAGRSGDAETALANYLDAARVQGDPRVAQRATRLALHLGDSDAALQATQRWTELADESKDAHAVLARLWLQHERADRAEAALRRVVALTDGGVAAGLREVADLVVDSEHPETALTAMHAIGDDYPEAAIVHYALGELFARTDEPEPALAALDRALDLESYHADALVLRARIQLEQGQPEVAFEQLGRAYRERPDDRGLALGYVNLLVEAGRVQQAKQEMQRVHERFGQDPFAVRTLALLAMQAQIWDHATLYLERLVAMNARTSMARYYLGRIAEQQGDCTRALRHFVKVGQGEHRFDAELRAALCMAEVGRVDEARLHLERMQAQYQSGEAVARIAIMHARIERQSGEPARALEVLSQALERHGEHAELRYARALTAAEVDRFDVARRDLNAVLERDPEDARALNALGYLLADRGLELDRARELIERALAQHPDDPAMLDSMGWVLFRQGQSEEALDYLQRAYELDPGPEIAAHLGEVLWTLGRRDDARHVWQTGREQGPENDVLKRTTQRFEP
ncbi:MAG: tetratricopeptide repeat protein [Halofilum sp. (in: g-proteobacteria)]